MTIYLSIYIFFYIINLISLQFLIKRMFGSKINSISLPHMSYYIIEYSKVKELYYGLIIALTGLPPFLLFFVKFNYLIETYTRFGFFFFYIIFLSICFQMIYYVQPIILRTVKFDLLLIKLKSCEFSFFELFFIVFFLALSLLSVFFFPDLCLISSLSL